MCAYAFVCACIVLFLMHYSLSYCTTKFDYPKHDIECNIGFLILGAGFLCACQAPTQGMQLLNFIYVFSMP